MTTSAEDGISQLSSAWLIVPSVSDIKVSLSLPGSHDQAAYIFLESSKTAVQVEMYADPAARGGVLEPEGIVEIKFRTPDLIKAMHRLDAGIAKLKREAQPGLDPAIKAREAALLPVYRQVCTTISAFSSA